MMFPLTEQIQGTGQWTAREQKKVFLERTVSYANAAEVKVS